MEKIHTFYLFFFEGFPKDDPSGGGELTMWMTGKANIPDVGPLYSGGNRKDYNVDAPINVTEFLSGQIKKTKYFVLSQHLMQNKYNVIFGRYSEKESTPARSWWKTSSYDSMMTYVKDDIWGQNKNVRSISAYNDQFVIFGAEHYGTEQSIVPMTNGKC